MNHEVVDLTLELLSPCFLRGATEQPEFRIASLRGVWRYWYRALYGRPDQTAPDDDELAVFGGIAANDGGGRASSVRLVSREIAEAPHRAWNAPPSNPKDPNGRAYLFFSMTMNRRSYLEPGQKFPLRLVFRNRATGGRDRAATERLAERARTSLALACAFSGLGARSRRMAGAVSLIAEGTSPLSPFRAEASRDGEDLASYLRALISSARRGPARDGPPPYHLVAPGVFRAGVLRTRTFTSWEEAADTVGRMYARFRQFDPPESTNRRQPDYDVAKAAASGKPIPPGVMLGRAAFGLPIRFQFRSLGGASVQATPSSTDRRGSPLFLTLERLANGRLAVVWCLFRSRLTEDDRIVLKPGDRTLAEQSLRSPDFSLIEQMLARDEWDSHPVEPES